jgi:HAD superfamily hydrolase (TIGR01509 family)
MDKKKIISIINVFGTIIIGVIIYFSGWISAPTILTLPEGTEISNRLINWLFFEYNKDSVLYIIGITIVLGIITYLIYITIQNVTKWQYENVYSENEIQEKFEKFLNDVNHVFIFGGDLSFLKDSPNQMKKIVSIGDKCEIICEDISNRKDINKNIYHGLVNSNVKIKAYTESTLNEIKNFKGQIKYKKNGVIESLFVAKIDNNRNKKEYEIINLSDQFLSGILIKNFKQVFEESKNPLISYIVLDLGGVYFDGDYENDFLNVVNEMLSENIFVNWDQMLLLDSDLNLGKINIVEYIEKNITRKLTKKEKSFIKEKWQNTWKPNEKMKKLVENLKRNGYKVTAISNLDKENGDMYKQKGYFENFDNNLFFSYEYKLLKPSKEFFQKICEKYNINTYEILFIDDHEKNINAANELGMKTIKFSINNDPNLENLYNELEREGILFR